MCVVLVAWPHRRRVACTQLHAKTQKSRLRLSHAIARVFLQAASGACTRRVPSAADEAEHRQGVAAARAGRCEALNSQGCSQAGFQATRWAAGERCSVYNCRSLLWSSSLNAAMHRVGPANFTSGQTRFVRTEQRCCVNTDGAPITSAIRYTLMVPRVGPGVSDSNVVIASWSGAPTSLPCYAVLC